MEFDFEVNAARPVNRNEQEFVCHVFDKNGGFVVEAFGITENWARKNAEERLRKWSLYENRRHPGSSA